MFLKRTFLIWKEAGGALSRTWFGPLPSFLVPCLPCWRGLRAAVSARGLLSPWPLPTCEGALGWRAQPRLHQGTALLVWGCRWWGCGCLFFHFCPRCSLQLQTAKLLWKGWNFGVSLAEHLSFHAPHRAEDGIRQGWLYKLKIRLVEGIVAPQARLLWPVASVRRLCNSACCVQGLWSCRWVDGPSAVSEHFEGCGPSNDVVPGGSEDSDPCSGILVCFLPFSSCSRA